MPLDSYPTRLWDALFLATFAWSATAPHDRLTWWLDALPALVTGVALIATRRRYPLTPLAYLALLSLCLIILVGAHYSFDRVPAFDWLRDGFGDRRNRFDKFAHFFQGFVPALVLREILVRLEAIRARGWLMPIVLGLSLAVSAGYELLEWSAALALGNRAEPFLGAMGDPWDTQSDMAMALFGAGMALALLGRIHDRQMRALGPFRTHGGSAPGGDVESSKEERREP
jgi:putative membrane protein